MEKGLLADDGYDTLSLLPFAIKRSVMAPGPKRKWAVPQVLQDIGRAITAPKRAMSGELDVNSPDAVEEALNLGLMGLGAGTAFNAGRPAPKGALATITTADRAPWGTPIKPGGGKPGEKYVFASDADFRIKPDVQDALLNKGVWTGLLRDAADSRVLRAHPEVLDMPTTLSRNPSEGVIGSYDLRSDAIKAQSPQLEAELSLIDRRKIGRMPPTLESTLLHEVNHGIHNKLGMDPGTSPETILRQYRDDLRKKLKLGLIQDEEKGYAELGGLSVPFDKLPESDLKKALYKAYLKTYGEENARLAQKLMGLTDEELVKRADLLPSFFQTPVHEQIAAPLLMGLARPAPPSARPK